jgi:hypothetical protein
MVAGCAAEVKVHDPGVLPGDETLWSDFQYLPSYPESCETAWSRDAQGIAHDDSHWYLSDSWMIYRYPVGADVALDEQTAEALVPEDCAHIGDLDFVDGELFAAMENCNNDSGNRLYVYDDQLRVKRWADVPAAAQAQMGWVAVNPIDGMIYASDSDADQLNVYARDFAPGGQLTLVRQVRLDRMYHRVQGGEFSASGHLYLVPDAHGFPEGAGIHVFRLDGPAATRVRFIHPDLGSSDSDLELEGITLWDMDAVTGAAEPMAGQIHWILLDNDFPLDRDDIHLKHIAVDDPERM